MHPRIRQRVAAALFAACFAAPAWAITGYYDTPQNDPVTGQSTGTSFTATPTLTSANGAAIPSSASAGGWNLEGNFGAFSATPIGPSWIATVSHIGFSSTFIYNGTTYNVVPGSGVIINPSTSDGTGIELYRISGTLPTYAQIYNSATDGPINYAQAFLTGRGTEKGSAVYALNTGDGYQNGQQAGWAPGVTDYTMRWGENYVYTTTFGNQPFLAYAFDAPGAGDFTPDEATLSDGDSGGGVFLYSTATQTWKLAGLNEGFANAYSVNPDYSNPIAGPLYDTLGLYSGVNQEVKYPSSFGYYNSQGQYEQTTSVGIEAVSYNVTAEATAMSVAQDFLNTANYTITGGLIFNSSNSVTELPVVSGNTTISQTLTFDNNFNLNVPAGSKLSLTGTINYSSGVTLGADGAGTLRMKTLHAPNAVITNGTLQIIPSGAAANVSIVNSLSISSGGRLDLTNNDLIINWSGTNPTSTIRSYLASAYDHGQWDLSGIGTSSVSGAIPITTLGYADNSLLGDTTFDKQTVSANSVLVKYTYVGDANLDGVVNAADLAMMSASGTSWMQGDFNYDGKVNADDYALFMLGLAAQGSAINPAPEPAGVVMIGAIAVFGLLRRRR